MDKDAVIEIIKRYKKALEARGVHNPQMVLFGSYSRGDYHEGSDIDLMVISRSFEGMDRWNRIELLADAICEVWEPIEAIAMTPEEWERGDSLVALFAREGEVVAGA